MLENTSRMWKEFQESDTVVRARKKIKTDGDKAVKQTKENAGKWSKGLLSILIGIILNIGKLILFAPVMILIEPIWTAIRGKSAKKRRLLG